MKPIRSFAVVISAGISAVLCVPSDCSSQTAAPPPLQLEAKIPLGNVQGRIDHIAFDQARNRLFIAELGNNTVGVVDLNDRKVIHRIAGLKEPQGVGYLPSIDTLFVANAGDGSVRLFRGTDFSAAGRIDLGDDADNIRVDIAANRVFVGYGGGALAVIDPASHSKIADIPLKAHPESFQLDRRTNQIFVNVPNARAIVTIDRLSGQETARWALSGSGSNFPMALDDELRNVLVVFRNPAKLGVYSMENGTSGTDREICADSDDLFVDEKRHRVYVSCGDGFLDVLDTQGGAYKHVAHIPTIAGARTSLFIPELDRLFLAVRATAGEPSALWIFRPVP